MRFSPLGTLNVYIKAGVRVLSLLYCFLLVLILHGIQPGFGQNDGSRAKNEESVDYFEKWLREDAVYIITDEERAVYEKLVAEEEKERFIEQFWSRRDPDPRTSENEFKTEHYRRIAYANERFSSGYPGWKSDRGKIYILHGPPAEIESHSSGENYHRPMTEGGGSTAVYPFEIWRYRHIEGLGNDIILEFVDSTLSGQYRLAVNPDEKDALLYSPARGPTRWQELGRNYRLMYSMRGDPFYRYKTYAFVQGAKEIKYDDLKRVVGVNIEFEDLPFQLREDYFSLNAGEILVPVTLQVDNRQLTFKMENGRHVARVAVYGVVTSLSNRVVAEFDHDLITSFSPEQLRVGFLGRSSFQKVLLLQRKQRYKLDFVVKDLNEGRVGVQRKAIIPVPYKTEQLAASSLLLSPGIQVLDGVPNREEMFVIGDVKVLPNLRKTFDPRQSLCLYFQVYNADIDQETMKPHLSVAYQLLKNGEVLKVRPDPEGQSIQYSSDQRVVFIQSLSLTGLQSGDYRVGVEVEDRLSGNHLQLAEDFTVRPFRAD